LRKVLAEHPEFAAPTAEEAAIEDPVLRAKLAIDLLEFVAAKELLKELDSSAAHYERGRLARLESDWEALRVSMAEVDDEALAEDVRMELGYELRARGAWEKLQSQLETIPKQHPRYSEARYFLGLAQFHSGALETARATWQALIKGCPQDPWIYRADWAWCDTAEGQSPGGRRMFSSGGGKRESLLNRIGYMGRRNPDLGVRKQGK
jgi:tetratricopeptide (TPR) repeat protein